MPSKLFVSCTWVVEMYPDGCHTYLNSMLMLCWEPDIVRGRNYHTIETGKCYRADPVFQRAGWSSFTSMPLVVAVEVVTRSQRPERLRRYS